MHEEEFGYALESLNRDTIPLLEKQGFTAEASLGLEDGRPKLKLKTSLPGKGVFLERTLSWRELEGGRVIPNLQFSLGLGLPKDDPEADYARQMFSPKYRSIALTGQSYVIRMPVEALQRQHQVEDALPENFADKAADDMKEFAEGPEADNLAAVAHMAVQLMRLQDRAKTLGLALTGSIDGTVLNFRNIGDGAPVIALQIAAAGQQWRPTAAWVNPNVTAKDMSNALPFPVAETDTLDTLLDKCRALVHNGNTPQERVINYLRTITRELKAAGHDIFGQSPAGELAYTANVDIRLKKQQGDALVSTCHAYQVTLQGIAPGNVFPSARLTGLPADHPRNVGLMEFDALDNVEKYSVLKTLRRTGMVPDEGPRSIPGMPDPDASSASLLVHAPAILAAAAQAPSDTTPAWVITLADVMAARKIALETGLMTPQTLNATLDERLAFRHQEGQDKWARFSAETHFSVSADAAGNVMVHGTPELSASCNLLGRSAVSGTTQTNVAGMPLVEALRIAAPEAVRARDTLAAEARDAVIAEKLGNCWLESVDLAQGTAHVGLASPWVETKMQLLEIAFEGGVPTHLTKDALKQARTLMAPDVADDVANRFVPAIEKHILKSVAEQLSELQSMLAELKMSNVRLTPDHKSVIVTTQGLLSTTPKDVTLDVKRSGDQILLTRAGGSKPSRPLLSLDGVRPLELVLAPVASQLLKDAQALGSPAAKPAVRKRADVER